MSRALLFVTLISLLISVACGPKKPNQSAVTNIEVVPIADRTAESSTELYNQNNLQKVHPDTLLPEFESVVWKRPTQACIASWRGFGEISSHLETLNGGHEGVDIPGDVRDPVYAAAAGRVVYTLKSCPQESEGDRWCGNGWGNHIVVDHGHNVFTRYAHLRVVDVKVGATVKLRQPIGEIGTSGLSDGPHLHFELGFRTTPFHPSAAPQAFRSDDNPDYENGEGVYDPKMLFSDYTAFGLTQGCPTEAK